jgi:hypothetical protein
MPVEHDLERLGVAVADVVHQILVGEPPKIGVRGTTGERWSEHG